MANIPGANNILPSVVSEVITQTRGVSVPGGVRIAAIIGEGSTNEVIVTSALGGGNDGLNPTYVSTNGSDGRHFLLKASPIISNRTSLFRNGFPLVGLEAQIDSNTFNNKYDYRVDIATGRIELQRVHLVDQGGSFYSVSATNVGLGTVSNLTLTNVNAASETWTIRCISVQRTALNVPIAQTAKFVAFGSISGNLLDANGNAVVWVANNTVATNGVLSFSIAEQGAPSSTSPFREGDSFTIKVNSGVLNKNDSLTVTYIPVGNLNDPSFFDSMDLLVAKHGPVSLTNTLSLGSDLAFVNSPPGIMAVQGAPPVPRRTSIDLLSTIGVDCTKEDDFIVPLPTNITPDPNSQIHFFVTDPATGVEKQLLPNQLPYYTFTGPTDAALAAFICDDTSAPAGHSFFYTVVKGDAVVNFGLDGYINERVSSAILALFPTVPVANIAQFTSSVAFDSSYIGDTIKIFDGYESANNGTFNIIGVSNGNLIIDAETQVSGGTSLFPTFITQGGATMAFELIDPVTGLVVASSYASDGYLINPSVTNVTDGYFYSASKNFNSFTGITGLQLRITSAVSTANLGLFDIIAVTSVVSSYGIQIRKTFVDEHLLHYEVKDSTSVSEYLVINHNIVPTGNALRITLIDVKDAAFFDAGWLEALSSLETQEIDILVPLPLQTISVIFQNALSHCQSMSNIRNKKERVLFIGSINGLTPDNLTGAKPAAVENIGILEGIQGHTVADILSGNVEDLANYSVPNAYGTTFRAVYFFPDQIVAQVGSDNVIIDGFYIAAAAAGFLSGVSNVAVPLTNKVLSGFSILRNRQFNQTTLESLAAAGVTILQPVAGGGRVLWGKTTTQSGFPEEEEISIIFIRDRIAKSMRQGFLGFIGIPEDADIIPTLTARALGLLNSFISQRLITDFADLVVKRDSVDPRQWNIAVRVQPVYPVNWIYIKIGIGLL